MDVSLRAIYIPKIGKKIGKIFHFFGPHIPILAPMGVKFGMEEPWSTPPRQISPLSVQRVAPAG